MSGSADAVEAAILHGVDAHPSSSYREDRRAAAGDSDAEAAPNTDDELGSDLPDDDADDDDEDYYRSDDDDGGARSDARIASGSGGGGIKGLHSSRTANRGEEGASNTGPKGVLRDRQLRAARESAARSAKVQATNRRMEGLALSSETYTEQVEREKRELGERLHHENMSSDDDEEAASREAIADLQAKERRREMRIAELKSMHSAKQTALVSGHVAGSACDAPSAANERWFGHLREVDERGYVAAIDNEHSATPVVVHIYSKAVAHCNVLTAALASLARQYPKTKFLQVQAAAIGFGKSSSSSITIASFAGADDDDDDDPNDEYDEFDPKSLEVLPTLLVYKARKLVANLVRIDLDPSWNQGHERDVRIILESYGALSSAQTTSPASHA